MFPRSGALCWAYVGPVIERMKQSQLKNENQLKEEGRVRGSLQDKVGKKGRLELRALPKFLGCSFVGL